MADFLIEEVRMGFSGLKAWFARHMPNSQQLAAVYGVIVLVVYGWTIYWYLWKLPSWLYFMTLGELLIALAYAMAVNFIESIFVLFILVFISLLLPSTWFRDQFVVRGTSLVILSLVALMKYVGIIINLQDIPSGMGRAVLLVLLGIILLVFIIGRIGFLRRIFDEVANRATIFLYIFMPLSLVSVLVVVYRNIIEALNG
jgi:hypothetical protein